MANALEAVETGMSFKAAAKTHGVPRSTLKTKYIKKYKKEKMGPETTLPEKYEADLVQWITVSAKNGFPITRAQLRDSVKRLVMDCKIPNKFQNNRPGYKWMQLFTARHPSITIRKSQLQEKCRKEVTQPKIDYWFSEVKKFIKENDLHEVIQDGSRIFNFDESAFFLAPSKNYVLVPRSELRTYSVTGNSEKENLTALIGSNADGLLIPPMVVFKYERIPPHIVRSVPKEWGIGRSENGWMTCAVFYEYITNVFFPWLKKNKIQLPIILFLDGHVSHLSYHLSNFCSQNGIHIIALYPHATHLLQPMDVAVFKQLKGEWCNAVTTWKFENNEIKLPKEEFSTLLASVLTKVTGIQNGFRKCGLFPFQCITVSNTRSTKKIEKEDSTDLSFNERFRFLDFIEKEVGEAKLKDFKEQKYELEDKRLFEIWMRLKQVSTRILYSTDRQSRQFAKYLF